MTVARSAWRRLAPWWVTAAVLLAANVAGYVWLSSTTVGRSATLRAERERLTDEVERLDELVGGAREDAEAARATGAEVESLRLAVFGRLDERLTRILRAVRNATRDAGLRPERYSYTADELEDLDLLELGISYTVEGDYDQIRRMLAGLQSSEQFLIVDAVGFRGEEDPRSRMLEMTIRLVTYVAEADRETLERLLGEPVAAPAGRAS